jgi:hypothetical protein
LSTDGHIFISENGNLVTAPDGTIAFAAYAGGDRIRVTVTDNLDVAPHTATIAYFKIPAGYEGARCPDQPCPESPLRQVNLVPYPFRVDASLREQGATLTDVRIVRIKE